MKYEKLFLTTAIEASKKSGEILRKGFYSKQIVQEKAKHDVVSQVDLDSEKIILDIITSAFPEHSVHSEESGFQDKDSEYKWYIDPLDGTSNFLSGVPYFSVSIALAYQGSVTLGVVYNPVVDELYVAEKGKGAFFNNKKIKVSEQNDLSNAFIASAYASNEKDTRRGLKAIEELAMNSLRVVINFSPALDLCNIARGRLDAMVDNGTESEDHAAGSLILTESGGKIQNYKKKNWDVEEIGIVASNGLLQAALLEYAK